MLTEFERLHAASIADPNPHLEPVPPLRRPSVLVASVVRKPPEVLQPFCAALAAQQFRSPGVNLQHFFLLNFPQNDPQRDAAKALFSAAGWAVKEVPAPVGDYGEGAVTRTWTSASFARMARLKNQLLQEALNRGVNYLFLIDADVMIDPWTVQCLLDSDAPIVSAVYWTQWQRAAVGSTDFVHAGPQVWLRHPYFLDDARYTEAEFRERLIGRQRLKVRGLGACTLISSAALRAGVSFSRVDALPPGPMAEGEDRHFCARAQRLHIPMVADAWPDVYHAYHPAEYGDLPKETARLQQPHHHKPPLGALVSLKIEPLEPVTDGLGRQMMLPPKWVRGRLGCLPVLPQIEEAVGGLTVGSSAIIRVMYPGHFPLAWLRSQVRLFRVTLLDAKPFGFAPVVDRELFMGRRTGRWLDTTTLTEPQVREVLETAEEAV